MKNSLIIAFFCLLTINLALAQTLYQQDSLEMELEIENNLELIAENGGARIQELNAQLLLYPEDDYRQTLVNLESTGTVEDNIIKFTWKDGKIEEKQFGYTALIQTNNKQREVKTTISFPLTNVEGYEKYLQATENIDSENPKIIAKATELAEGEDDLFKVVFKLASWVEENVEYDLNTLTATSSQKASWVLENKQGVCDEMSSLFVAMARSLGIPARFVSGISYSTSELFVNNWQPHGWAEVYFPEIGWVGFDITFGEFGYVDVTHIKLRDGFDPAEPATKYEWLANAVTLDAKQPLLNVIITKEGKFVVEDILLEQEILSSEVGFGSYNLVKAIVKNTADHYTATALQLSVPEEIEILGRNRRNLLLLPKEVKETYWLVRVPEDLDQNFFYNFPTIIYTEKNISTQDTFSAQQGKNVYSQAEIEALTVQDEEKSYSRKVSFNCDYPSEIKVNREAEVSCTIKNSGNTNLQQLNFCLNEACEIIDLPINQEKTKQLTITGETVGWNKVLVSAENTLVEKRSSLEIMVLDLPKIKVSVEHPATVQYGENIEFRVNLEKISFATPEEVVVIVNGLRLENKWNLQQLTQEENLLLLIENPPLAKKNKIKLLTSWQDQDGTVYTDEQEILIIGEASGFGQKLKMSLNWFLNLFS
ncbi:MAG: transglutaminase-like domain-containing protein [Nanoarchaeota archaeon]|nr:transglutaminase-like domain-containing protein [Nanoarchaeota archaeon]MBU1622288.1 transglutaminase-like domain-containing protein [Nanoarchaeota archaeon]